MKMMTMFIIWMSLMHVARKWATESATCRMQVEGENVPLCIEQFT
jgi:hypothetical protein